MSVKEVPANAESTEALSCRPLFRLSAAALSSPIFILVIAAALRAVELATFEGTVNDGTDRVSEAAAWVFHGAALFGRTVWPLGNYVLPAAALVIWNDPYWSVRIFFALICLTNVWLAYLLGKGLFGRPAGIVAAWVVALMPFHILVSADGAMSEGPYVSFILLALLAAVRYAERPGVWLAAVAGLSITLASSVRFDGVVWGAAVACSILLAALVCRQSIVRTIGHLTAFGCCALAFSIAVFSRWAMLYHDPFFILNQAKLQNLQYFAGGTDGRWPYWMYQSYAAIFWPASTFILMTPLVAAFAWIGVFSAMRKREVSAAPLVLGIFIAWAFLAFAALRHDILAQWRYSLVLVVVLSVFCCGGAKAVHSWLSKTVPLGATWVVAVAVGLMSQGFVTYVAYSNHGVLSRQLGMLSPIRPNQYQSRELVSWIRGLPPSSGPVLLTPQVIDQAYLALHLPGLERGGKVVTQPYYQPGGELAYTYKGLVAALQGKLGACEYVVTNARGRAVGLRDGLFGEVLRPSEKDGGNYVWNGILLRRVGSFGENMVWRVASWRDLDPGVGK